MPVSPDQALRVARATGRLRAFDFSFNLHDPYRFWSGIIGGTFLMISYFGTDQSQVCYHGLGHGMARAAGARARPTQPASAASVSRYGSARKSW